MAEAAGDSSKPFFPAKKSASLVPPRRRGDHVSLTAESRFWRSFRPSELTASSGVRLVLPVTGVSFSPVAPHDFAVASSASVHLFSGREFSPLPSFSSFSDVAYSPSFRCDGALLAAAGESGQVQIFRADKPSSQALRRLRGHSAAARVARYPVAGCDKLHIFSAGDDAMVAYWDAASESSPLLSFPAAHRDYIRGGDPSPTSPQLFATGSYDHSVKLWDVRAGNGSAVLDFSLGDPVECVLFLPSGGLIATAGGNHVKIFDIIGGGRLLHSVESHNKTVTSLALAQFGEASRLLSVSIDGYLKTFDFAAFKITHSVRYPAQLLSVGFSPSGFVRVVGTSKGLIYMGAKKRMAVEDSVVEKVAPDFPWAPLPRPKRVLMPYHFRYFTRGQNEKPKEGDYVVKKPKKVKIAEHDRLLMKFRHKDALVAALNKKNPAVIVAVMEELMARKKLMRSIGNLDNEELGLLLMLLHRYCTMPRYARFLTSLAKKVLEMHAEDIRSTDELRGHVRNLQRMVTEEILIQRSLQQIQGMISPLLAIAGRR